MVITNKSRTAFLAITAVAIAVTLGKSVAHPEVASPSVKDYTFPEYVMLPQWKLLTSKPVNSHLVQPPAYISGDFIAGKHYRYLKNGKNLDIEMRYLANTNGDLKSFITSQTGDLSSGLKQDKTGGFYSLYIYESKAYLSTCINPLGHSTVTSDQFKRNIMIHNNHLQRIIPWLTGKAEFQDKRCMWAHLSTSLEGDAAVDEAYETLETTWHDWQSYWRSHYPN